MKQYCHLHPTVPAQFQCDKCNHLYCAGCIDVREKGGYDGQKLYFCPKCNFMARWLGLGNVIDPFWGRLHQFFLYPLKLQPLILIFVAAFLLQFFSDPGLLNILIRVSTWGVMIKYAYESLKKTARGDLAPPELTPQTLTEDMGIVFKQYVIYFVIGAGFFYITFHFGPVMGVPFLIFALFMLPAMIMLLVTTESVFHAINPAIFIRLAFRIGKGYLIMYFFLILLLFAPAYLMNTVAKAMPSNFLIFLFAAANNYYTIIFYHLMGYVILQYHEEIGYEINIEDVNMPEAEASSAIVEIASGPIALLEEINLLVRNGSYDEAIALIEEKYGSGSIDALELAERYDNLLKMTKKTKKRLKHGASYIDLLAKNNRKDSVFKVYDDYIAFDKTFLATAFALFKIAGWLSEGGKPKESIAMFNRLVKSYPDDPLVPKAYFRSAQIFHERLMNLEKTRRILNGLIKKYPDHDIANHAKNYLAQIG